MLTNQQIIQQLKKFRAIRPDERFSADLKALILAQSKIKPRFNFFRAISKSLKATGMAVRQDLAICWRFFLPVAPITVGALVVVLVLILILPNSFRPVLSSFDDKKLSEEFNGLSINIQLKEISYQQITDQTIAAAIREIINTKINHFNSVILEMESNEIDFNSGVNPQVDEFLNQVIF